MELIAWAKPAASMMTVPGMAASNVIGAAAVPDVVRKTSSSYVPGSMMTVSPGLATAAAAEKRRDPHLDLAAVGWIPQMDRRRPFVGGRFRCPRKAFEPGPAGLPFLCHGWLYCTWGRARPLAKI